jgi:hypothetical protein
LEGWDESMGKLFVESSFVEELETEELDLV